MIKFETTCPHCGTVLTAQDDWIGMEVECPQCKQVFPIRDNPSEPDPTCAVQTDNGGTFTFVCPDCNAVAELPKNLLGQQYECQMCFETHIAEVTTERQCPYCGLTVKYHATVCKFCKADLTKLPPSASTPKQEETFIFICPECDAVEFLPVSMKGKQYECKECCETIIAEPAEERKCPHCGKMIKIKAAICKHCQKSVNPLTSSPSEEKKSSPGRKCWGITEAEAAFLRKLGYWMCGLAVVCLALSLLRPFIPIPSVLRSSFPSLVLAVLFFAWIYRLWDQVPAAEAETTPGKAVGFYFIPVYQIIWFLKMPLQLSRHYDRFNKSGITVSKCWLIYAVSVTFFSVPLTFFFLFWGPGLIPTLIEVLNSILWINWMIRLQKCLQNIPRIG